MTIDYCEARTRDGIGRVAEFLGQPAGAFGDWTTAKRNSDDIVSRFSNPGEVRAYLDANGLGYWAHEGEPDGD